LLHIILIFDKGQKNQNKEVNFVGAVKINGENCMVQNILHVMCKEENRDTNFFHMHYTVRVSFTVFIHLHCASLELGI
jgi:hypothetical protein